MVKEMFPETEDYELIALLPVGGIATGSVPSSKHKEFKDRDENVKV